MKRCLLTAQVGVPPRPRHGAGVGTHADTGSDVSTSRMTLYRRGTGSRPNQRPVVAPQSASEQTTEMSELARAFDSAQHDSDCIESWTAADSWTDGCAELTDAVRAFVVAGRADGSPPERVLANIKSVTRAYFFHGVDEVHGDRLQTLILREFLATYYDAVAPAEHALQPPA